VLHDALAACARLRRLLPELTMAVNISPLLLDDTDLPNQIARALHNANLAPSALVAEITESRIIADPMRAGVTLGVLRERGVACAIDDFGTGHASLLSLLRLPFSELKIDRAFVAGCADDPEAEKIVRATIGLAREMRLNVVAEGIETHRTETLLRELGCGVGQGFRYGRPMSERDLLTDCVAFQSQCQSHAAENA
jgi:EAL domain-containing protein (putative c-di-GMP-specific phosphodiesterase class I)